MSLSVDDPVSAIQNVTLSHVAGGTFTLRVMADALGGELDVETAEVGYSASAAAVELALETASGTLGQVQVSRTISGDVPLCFFRCYGLLWQPQAWCPLCRLVLRSFFVLVSAAVALLLQRHPAIASIDVLTVLETAQPDIIVSMSILPECDLFPIRQRHSVNGLTQPHLAVHRQTCNAKLLIPVSGLFCQHEFPAQGL